MGGVEGGEGWKEERGGVVWSGVEWMTKAREGERKGVQVRGMYEESDHHVVLVKIKMKGR